MQNLYERKLKSQESEFLSLEQLKLEVQQNYETKIQALIESNRANIENLLVQFKVDLSKV